MINIVVTPLSISQFDDIDFQEFPPIYDSYDSKDDEVVMDDQRDFFTTKWGAGFQEQIFQEEP